MPADTDASAIGDAETQTGLDSAEDASLGGDGDGADTDGQDGTQDAENASTTPETTDSETESDDALTEALASGKADDLDSEGEAKKAKPQDAEKPAADEAEKKGDEPDDKADEATPEEKAALDKARTKADRKELDNLFKERRGLRKEVEDLKPAKAFADGVIKHAIDAGLIQQTDDGLDTKGLYQLIEQDRFLKGRTKDQVAAYYRSLADTIAPLPKAVEPAQLSENLQAAVDAGYLDLPQAQLLAQQEADKAKPPEEKKPDAKVEEKPKTQQPSAESAAATNRGYTAIAEVSKSYQSQHKADWERIGAAVEKRLAPLIAKAHPDTWKDLADMACKAVIADLRPATKTPAKTTRPGQPPPKKSGVLSEEEELDALAKGRSF